MDSWHILACSSDYQDEQDGENHKMTSGADITMYNNTMDLVSSHGLLINSLFTCECFHWSKNGFMN